MATIIDRRTSKDITVATNRQRFLQRYKKNLKSQIEKHVQDTRIKNIKDGLKDIKIKRDDIKEPSYSYDRQKGKNTRIYTGNKQYHKNDKVNKRNSPGQGGGGSGGDYDELTFTLTKEEFIDLFFDDLELPNFIKKSFKKEYKKKFKRAGYTKVGPHSKLNLKKTFESALMRKIACKEADHHVPFLDDIDLRYNLFTKQPINVSSAAMFCVMDVSYSMSDDHRLLAKYFYVLLYLFLEKVYKTVTLHFIVHHDNAYEVTEEEFFSTNAGGGTQPSKALVTVKSIITDKYQDGLTNLYLAHASDGDIWAEDIQPFSRHFLDIVELFQYWVYIDIKTASPNSQMIKVYKKLSKKCGIEKLKWKRVMNKKDIYPAIQDLFKKQEV